MKLSVDGWVEGSAKRDACVGFVVGFEDEGDGVGSPASLEDQDLFAVCKEALFLRFCHVVERCSHLGGCE